MWYYSVHTPIQAKPEHVERFRQKARSMGLHEKEAIVAGEPHPKSTAEQPKRIMRRVLQSEPVYAAMIWSLDENIGRLLQALDDTGERDNTIVVFTSDNGGLATAEGSPTCNAPLAEGKGWTYEGGVREPLIVRWPGIVRPASRAASPVTSPDFYPTLMEAVGLPSQPGQHVDGESFLPLLKGADWRRRAPLFWHYPHYGNQGGAPGSSIRKGDFKLIEFFEEGRLELYNLADDIGERRNLADIMPAKRDELHAELQRWRAFICARIPPPNPDNRRFLAPIGGDGV